MPRPPRKKAAIERAALELFAEMGIDAASIRMIAERAGVTEGALYRHHASKEDLVRALFRQYFEGIGSTIRRASESENSLRGRLDAMLRGFYEEYDADPKAFQFVLLVQHQVLDKVRASEEDNPVAVLQGVVEQAIASGEISAPPERAPLLAQMLLGAAMQVAVGNRYGRVKGKLADQADAVALHCEGLLKAS